MDKNFIDISFIQKYHLELIKETGIHNAKALGWHSREAQLKRFDALAQAGDMSGCSVLDVGCGLGDLLPFLAARYPDMQYTGIDINSLFLEAAAERYHDWPNVTFLHTDIGTANLPAADYVLASGALSYRNSEEDFLFRMIRKLYGCANKAVIFNLLSSLSEPNALLCTYEPVATLNYCKTLSPDVSLVEGYWDGDFTVRVGIW